ncbi:Protein painting of fourth [Lucilia cuprina]|uniref:Protein painting of fourth n=1 Tax=Lucilia cuprina TaxID=7375 RepID=A0A0L0C2M3_LUCCU|nr:Protein painting of fourth [Lucilia cuprina]KNC26575.1 Protein painting of fourth [Lucilia cuprina]
MNKYNNNGNFSRAPVGDSSMRFNKRPRYGVNNSGAKSSPRFKHQNQTGYQYSPNRNVTTDSFQCNPYDKGPRNFYGISPKRPNYNPQKNNQSSSPYLHKPNASAISSPSSSSFSLNTQNVLNLPPTQPPPMPSTSVAAQNSQQQQLTPNMMDNSNLYGFGYNSYYPTSYNNDRVPTDTASTYGGTDAITPFMWQTITSTPPPKLPQHQLQQQPPLPQPQPPPILPPLPSDDKLPYLPPPPMSASSMSPTTSSPSSAKFNFKNNTSNDKKTAAKTIVKMKTKRKAISERYRLSKSWCEEDAILALKTEESNARKLQTDIILIIRFPDPELSREIVKCYSPDIESVHFQLNYAPRYCLVHLKPGTDVEKTIDDLSKVPFGTGFLSVEIKQIPYKVHSTKLNEVDPYTLYVGNLPTTIACKTLKNHFPGAARIDIGFAQRMKYTRYAFIRYQSVEKAIEAYNRMLDAEIGGRTITIRFRRVTPTTEGNKDGDAEHLDSMHDDELINHTTLESDEKTVGENTESFDVLQENNTADVEEHNSNDAVEKVSHDLDISTDNNSTEAASTAEKNSEAEDNVFIPLTSSTSITSTIESLHNKTKISFSTGDNSALETNNTNPPTISTSQANNSNSLVPNIKPEPDIDPSDIVIRDNALTSRLEVNNDNIKQEEQIALYDEFFAPPNNQNDNNKEMPGKSNNNDVVSLHSTADETDTMSTVSTNSLGEFLQNCQRSQMRANCMENLGPPPAKRNKQPEDVLAATVKQESQESNNIVTAKDLTQFTKDTIAADDIKQELLEEPNVSDKTTSTTDSANKKVPKRRDRVQAAITPVITKNSTISASTDDVVPSTALFFRSNSQTSLTVPSNDSDYDEFYDTRTNISSQTTTSVANIKKEPLNISANKSTNENCRPKEENGEVLNRRDVNKESKLSQMRNNISSLTTSNTPIDEDDLVPAQNILGSYRPFRSEIKEEMEHDDIFAVPINRANNLSENNYLDNLNNETVSNLTSLSDRSSATRNDIGKRSTEFKENDDDVIIVSENITPQAKQTNSNSSLLNNIIFRRHTDLVTFTSKPIVAVTIPKREVSTLIHHDNLDRLYEQLDADSDNEL